PTRRLYLILHCRTETVWTYCGRQDGMAQAWRCWRLPPAVEDRVAGLDSGADGYLVKPFAMQELIARVRGLLPRPGVVLGERLCAGNLTFDSRTRLIEVAGRPLSVPRRELLTLEALLRRAGGSSPRMCSLIRSMDWMSSPHRMPCLSTCTIFGVRS